MEKAEFPGLDSYPETYLGCRAIARSWVPQGLPWVEQYAEGPVVMERLKCGRCTATRTDQRTPYGNLLRRSYKHGEGYKLGAGSGDKSLFAKERIHRILGDVTQRQRQVG